MKLLIFCLLVVASSTAVNAYIATLEKLKFLKILVIGDSLARRFTTQLAFNIAGNKEVPNKYDLARGFHDSYNYRPLTKSLQFVWAPEHTNLRKELCIKDVDKSFDIVFISAGIHDLEKNKSFLEYPAIPQCIDLDTTLVVWRLPNFPTNGKHGEFRKRFDMLRLILSKIPRIHTIDADKLYVDKGDTPEHTGFFSRQNVVNEFLKIVGNVTYFQ